MLKILGLITILVSSVIMGFIMANELNERTKTLRDIKQSATGIKSDLEYRASDICECFKLRGNMFGKASKYIADSNLFPTEALIRACEELNYLHKEDKEIIFSYAKNLSAEDIGSQINNINWLIENITIKIKESEAEYSSKNRLYKSGGALLGLGFIILLL